MNTKAPDIEWYVGKKYTFYRNTKEKYIGKGGNGSVYNVNCDELDGEFVVKILNQKNRERRERFRREIDAMGKINQKYPNQIILPLIDYKLSKKESWYITPKTKCLDDYLKDHKLTFYQRYELCLKLCESLKTLHSLNYYHRDIKTANIFIKEENALNVLLGDFGLVWNEDYQDITIIEEAIGPINTKPPECYKGFAHIIPNERQYAVDVYEFAKTMWMILKGIPNCFNGRYICGLNGVSLELNDVQEDKRLNIKTLGPLHELLEKATIDDPSLRPKMEEVLSKMNEFLEVNRDDQKVKEWKLKVLTKNFINKNRAEIQGYHSAQKIVELLNNIKDKIYLTIEDFPGIIVSEIIVEECSVLKDVENIIIIVDRRKNQYLFSVEILYINQDNVQSDDFKLSIRRCDFSNEYKEYQSIFQYSALPGLPIENMKFCLDREVILKIRMKS